MRPQRFPCHVHLARRSEALVYLLAQLSPRVESCPECVRLDLLHQVQIGAVSQVRFQDLRHHGFALLADLVPVGVEQSGQSGDLCVQTKGAPEPRQDGAGQATAEQS